MPPAMSPAMAIKVIAGAQNSSAIPPNPHHQTMASTDTMGQSSVESVCRRWRIMDEGQALCRGGNLGRGPGATAAVSFCALYGLEGDALISHPNDDISDSVGAPRRGRTGQRSVAKRRYSDHGHVLLFSANEISDPVRTRGVAPGASETGSGSSRPTPRPNATLALR